MPCKIKIIFLFLGIILSSNFIFASYEKSSEKFDAGKLIVGHIADAHEWHLWGETKIFLPVIIYSQKKGISVFSSKHFEEGNGIYNGYKMNGHEIAAVNDDGSINEEATKKIWDLSITKNVLSMFVGVAILLLIMISIARRYSRNPNVPPKGLQSWLEPIIVFIIDDVIKPGIGEKHYRRFVPFLLTVFFFILINNMLGQIPIFPGGANFTGNIACTMTLAVIVFIIQMFNTKKYYWRHIFAMPGVPGWVLPLITFIEVLGIFLKPFVLMVRLFANMLAGHMVILSFISLIFIFGELNQWLGWGVSILSMAFSVFVSMLELLVAFIQAYVFTLLSSIYFGMALEEDHHHSEEHA
ncbi:MAG: F0F1 ATP synthase subunit A [Bacteroidetes bacterium]|nr:F0F1 ATP synthase subunit A [Bacteroidota bacterium]